MAAVLQATRATHLHLDHHTAKDMAAAMARNNILHSRSMDTAMARKLVLADSQVMVDQPPATVNHSHHQPPVVTASKLVMEVLHTAHLQARMAVQETTITTSTTSMVVPLHIKTRTHTEANSTLHPPAMGPAMAVNRVTMLPSPDGSKPLVTMAGRQCRK